ncbi:NAD(P)H-dependent FMN reductase [compost metagenome]
MFADDGQIVLNGEQAQLSDGVAARLNEALDSFYLALSRRKPPVPNTAASLLTRQTA